MLKTNEDKLVMLSVAGQISAPACQPRICFDGVVRVTPGTGGITYNVKVGDCAFGLAGDHVEPGVSTKNPDEKANSGYNTLSCVGNTAYVVSGDAKGAKGTVTGKHGGIEHVLIHFDRETLDKLQVGDKIQVRSYGQGLALTDYPSQVMNLIRAPVQDGHSRRTACWSPGCPHRSAGVHGSGLGITQPSAGLRHHLDGDGTA